MIKVLFPYNIVPNDNEFVARLHEIVSEIGEVEAVVSLNEFWSPTRHYDFIIINWPDYLFNWKPDISDLQIETLHDLFKQYRSAGTKILTILHDEFAHGNRSKNRDAIFEICYKNADGLLHLGNYSLHKYKNDPAYHSQEHFLLYHPLFKEFNFDLDKSEIREKYGYGNDDFIVIVPGGIRHKKEEDWTINAFNQLKIKNKHLIFLRASHIYKPYRNEPFKYFLYHLKYQFIKAIYKRRYFHKFMPNQTLSELFSIANLVILPRIGILNSGNVFLSTQFQKRILGMAQGNITEWLEKFNHIVLTNEMSVDQIKSIPHSKLTGEYNYPVQNYISDETIENQIKNIIYFYKQKV